MKARLPRLLAAFVCVSIFCALFAAPSATRAQDAANLDISSKRFIVIDADTGEVFAEQNSTDEVAIASLTKIYTTIEALSRAPLDTEITTDESDLFDASSTTMGFGPGETFTLEQLLYGMMLPSGNDAAHAIARTLGAQPGDTPQQSVDRFVGWTNERIRNMGLTQTELKNPHGLGVPGHHSSAHDLAAFTRYALEFPTFVSVIGTATYDVQGYTLSNTNRLLSLYGDLVGGKTGFDEDSGYCLVEVAQRDGSTMISVTLDGVAPDVWYQDNATLLDFAFDQKAARVAADRPIEGELVTFVDPNAAVLAQIVTPGASLGQDAGAQGTMTATVPASTPVPTSTPQTSIAASGESDGDWSFLFAMLVAVAVVIAAVAIAALNPPKIVSAPTETPEPHSSTAPKDD